MHFTGKNAKTGWYISWDAYFMGVALITAQRSKDPVTQVGSGCVFSYFHYIKYEC